MRVRVQLIKALGPRGWEFADVERIGKEVNAREEL
jgi:hypothetical protein